MGWLGVAVVVIEQREKSQVSVFHGDGVVSLDTWGRDGVGKAFQRE